MASDEKIVVRYQLGVDPGLVEKYARVLLQGGVAIPSDMHVEFAKVSEVLVACSFKKKPGGKGMASSFSKWDPEKNLVSGYHELLSPGSIGHAHTLTDIRGFESVEVRKSLFPRWTRHFLWATLVAPFGHAAYVGIHQGWAYLEPIVRTWLLGGF